MTLAGVVELARGHGLAIVEESIRFNEIGLDYRVAFATAEDGTEWVLRIPRRDDVSAKIGDEARILRFVQPRLSVAVPDWRVTAPDLIAYPSLPGTVGLTVNDASEPVWHFDPESATYARSCGRLLAELQAIDPAAATDAGLPRQEPAQVREEIWENLRRVEAEFTIADHLRRGWEEWLADDGLWPSAVAFTHGELYPAHLLLSDAAEIQSVLDWTTAKVGDPATDFAIHHASSTSEAFQQTIDAFTAAGGTVPERLSERCVAIFAAGPLNYALYALVTGDPAHAEAAAAGLNPVGD